MRRSPLAAAAGLALSLLASPALACWDGYAAVSSRVSLARATEDTRWRPEQARALALALARLEALVPAGYALRADPSGEIPVKVFSSVPEGARWRERATMRRLPARELVEGSVSRAAQAMRGRLGGSVSP